MTLLHKRKKRVAACAGAPAMGEASFDLTQNKYFLLLASGPARPDGGIGYHNVRGASAEAIDLTA